MRLVVTLAVLAAVYFLVVRPVLDTTESIGHDVNHAVTHGLHSAQKSFDQATGQGGATHKGRKK
jgi:hypothetical protein